MEQGQNKITEKEKAFMLATCVVCVIVICVSMWAFKVDITYIAIVAGIGFAMIISAYFSDNALYGIASIFQLSAVCSASLGS